MIPPEDERRPRATMSPAFWAALAVGLALVLAGAVVGVFGARLFPPSQPAERDGGHAATASAKSPRLEAHAPAPL